MLAHFKQVRMPFLEMQLTDNIILASDIQNKDSYVSCEMITIRLVSIQHHTWL